MFNYITCKAKMTLKKFTGNNKGQAMTEYGLIIALIAVAVIAALAILGPKIAQVFTEVANSFPEGSSSTGG